MIYNHKCYTGRSFYYDSWNFCPWCSDKLDKPTPEDIGRKMAAQSLVDVLSTKPMPDLPQAAIDQLGNYYDYNDED